MLRRLLGGLLVAAAVIGPGCAKAPLRYGGYVAVDGRLYVKPPKYSGQLAGNGPSMVIEPEFFIQTDREVHTLTLRPFLRMDPFDSKRTHYDLRQADYSYAGGRFSFGAGFGLFSFGKLESYRPSDVINQTDFVENLDGSQRLGQPYLRGAVSLGDWNLALFYLPYHRGRTYPGARGRLRSPLVVNTDQPLYESKYGAWHPTVAARVSGSVGEFDLGLTGFSGLSREPRFFAQLTDATEVAPQYDLLQQGSLDAQWTHDAIVAKVEGVARWWSSGLVFSFAVSGGLEYSFFDILESGVDLTLVGEYHFDNRDRRAPLTLFENDAFAGFRLAVNDEGDTQILAGGVMDTENLSSFIRVEAHRRFGDRWKVFLRLRYFLGRTDILESATIQDSHVEASLAYYF